MNITEFFRLCVYEGVWKLPSKWIFLKEGVKVSEDVEPQVAILYLFSVFVANVQHLCCFFRVFSTVFVDIH